MLITETTPLVGVQKPYTLSEPRDVENANIVPNNGPFHDVVKPANLYMIIASLWLGTFLSAADTTVVSTTANTIASSMNGSEKLSWIATSYLLTNTIFQPLVGRISDVFGRRTVLIFAQFWFALGCLCCSLSQSVTQFAVARALAGIGGGGMSALSSIIATDIIPLGERGMFQGYANLLYGLGQFTGPILGSAFVAYDEESGWRWMFAIQVPFVVLAGILVFANVHEYRQDQMKDVDMKNRFALENLKKIDLPGSFLLSCTIVSLLMIFNAQSLEQVLLYLAFLFISATAFALVEKYIMTVRIIPPSAFQGVLRISAFIVFFAGGSIAGIGYITPLYLQIVHDFSQFQLGIFNSISIFAAPLGSLSAGWYLKQDPNVSTATIIERSIKLSMLSCLALFTGFSLILFQTVTLKPTISRSNLTFGTYAELSVILLGSCISAVGYGAFLVAILILVVGIVGVKTQATVTGMNYMFRSMGQSSGVGISLGLYNLNVVRSLAKYFQKDVENGHSILNKLTSSTAYLRKGMPSQYLSDVLLIYKQAIYYSVAVVFGAGSIAFLFSLMLHSFHSNQGK